MTVEKGDMVTVDFVCSVEGKVIDTSLKRVAQEAGIFSLKREYAPLQFKIGESNVVAGFEEALIGMQAGEMKEVSVLPEKAYGLKDPKRVKNFPKGMFEKMGMKLEEGNAIIIRTPKGEIPAKVMGLSEDEVSLDLNHVLAGKTLQFRIYLQEKQ